jgi:alpha-tubulin suppressor-like RCC1 family protein
MPFISGPDGDLKTAFVSDSWLLDQFVGNTLFVWGGNVLGQLGDNTIVSKSNPVQTVTGGINWKQVSCGYSYSAGIKTDGTLWLWGRGVNGNLGNATTTSRSSPVQTVAFGTNWKQVSCGYIHAAAIKTDGTLWCWGNNQFGTLGDNTNLNRNSPVQTVTFATNWKQVSAGLFYTAAIKTDGTLWSWGFNFNGNLGDNTTTYRSSPVQTVAFGTNWVQVACGQYVTAAIKNDGTLWTWGSNGYGQLGDNTTTQRSSPVQTVAFGTNWKSVAATSITQTSNITLAAIKKDGTLWTWGRNNNGQLGDNTTTNRSSPVQTITFASNWKQVSCGYGYMGAIKNDGTLWSWGLGTSGQLGNNAATSRSSPIQTSASGTNWKQLSVANFTVAVTNGDL